MKPIKLRVLAEEPTLVQEAKVAERVWSKSSNVRGCVPPTDQRWGSNRTENGVVLSSTISTHRHPRCIQYIQTSADSADNGLALRLPSWWEGASGMLKISIIESKTRRLFVLEGKLVVPWTNELKGVCQGPGSDLDDRELVIDVRGLTIIGAEGEDVLLDLIMRGAKFRRGGVFTKQILKQLARRARRNGHEKNSAFGQKRNEIRQE